MYEQAGESRGQVFMPSMALCCLLTVPSLQTHKGTSPKMSVQARHWPTALTGRCPHSPKPSEGQSSPAPAQ